MSDSINQSPSGLAALLDQLRDSQAWQQLIADQPPPSPPAPTPPPARVADLLAQLAAPQPSPRSCSFQDALPLLARLGGDPAFVASIKQMRHDQDALERLLFADREAIHRKYADKVQVARVTAHMVGAGISRHDADMLQDAFQKELRKFDKDRVLPAWDGLLSRQQAQMQALGVPNMFVSSDRKANEVQIVQVLLGLVGSDT